METSTLTGVDSDECHNDVICIVCAIRIFSVHSSPPSRFYSAAFGIQMDTKAFAADNNENQTNTLERNHLNAHFSFHCWCRSWFGAFTHEMRFKFYLVLVLVLAGWLTYSAKAKFSELFRTMRAAALVLSDSFLCALLLK